MDCVEIWIPFILSGIYQECMARTNDLRSGMIFHPVVEYQTCVCMTHEDLPQHFDTMIYSFISQVAFMRDINGLYTNVVPNGHFIVCKLNSFVLVVVHIGSLS